MKRILFFIPTLGGGGAEKVLVNLVNSMDIDRFDITLQTLFDVGVNKEKLNKNIKYKYVFKKLFRGNVQILKLFSPEYLFNRMVKEKYDIIISYLQSPVMRIVSGCKDPNVKLISWIHNEFHSTKPLEALYRNKKEFLDSFHRFDRVVFVANSAQKALTNILPGIKDKSITLYNTNETELIRKMADQDIEFEFEADKINLISTGRFTKQKAFDRLIKIVAKLKNEGYPAKLYLLGEGKLYKKYVKLIKELSLRNDVVFLGYKQNPYKYLKRADLFVCSSIHEGFSTAVTEALIVGTAVVATDCSGMKELLGKNSEYGIITGNSVDQLYQGIVDILGNNKLSNMRVKAQLRGRSFEKTQTVKAVEKFFIDQLEGRG